VNRAKSKKQVIVGLKYIILIIFALVGIFPILWLIVTSLKLPREYFSSPPVWIPKVITIEHYKALFTTYGGLPYFKNSLIIALGNMFLVLLIGIPTAYAISKYKVGGEKFSFWILSQRMLPPVATVIPLFLLYRKFNLIDTHIGLILAYAIFNLPFCVWMLIGFFDEFPVEIQEQAMIDGCTEIQSLGKVVLPVIMPGIAVVAIFCFIFSWNELMLALTLTTTNAKTITVLFASILQSPTGIFFGEAAGAAVVSLIPALILTFFFQKYIVRGLTLGSVKG